MFLLFGITALAFSLISSFIDLASLLMVIGGASGFAPSSTGTLFSDARLAAASEDSVESLF